MLRQALGSLKDRAAIGKAAVLVVSGGGGRRQDQASFFFSEMEIAVVRATSHEESPAEERYVHEILFLVSNSPAGSTPFLARRISRRLRRTRDPVVALKTLLLVHRLMRGGDRNFEHQLRNAWLSGDLDLRWTHRNRRRRDGRGTAAAFGGFLGGYVGFLEERMGWVINQAGKLQPSSVPHDHAGQAAAGSSFHFKNNYDDTKSAVETMIFYTLPRCQTFLDRIMDCSPGINQYPVHRLIQVALCNVLREGFQVYASFCEGVTTLVDSFSDLKKSSGARPSALAIFRRASSQTHRLADFFEACKNVSSTRSSIKYYTNLDFPDVRIITPDCVTTMEEKEDQYYFFSTSSIHDDREVVAAPDPVVLFASPKLETKICTVWVKFDEEEAKKPAGDHHDVGELLARDDCRSLQNIEAEERRPYHYYNPFDQLPSPRTKTGNFLRG